MNSFGYLLGPVVLIRLSCYTLELANCELLSVLTESFGTAPKKMIAYEAFADDE